jgi:hypothetical protein
VRIRYERSGGFANISSTTELDISDLPVNKARQLKKLVEKARLFDQPTKALRSLHARDEYQYELTIEDGDRTHTVETSDTALSADLAELIEWLEKETLAQLKAKRNKQ